MSRPMRLHTTREMIVGGLYDYSSNKIQCVADAIGSAQIFEFGNGDKSLRILAFDAEEARVVFDEVQRHNRHW